MSFREACCLCAPRHPIWQRPQHNLSLPAPFCRGPGVQGYKKHGPDCHPLLPSICSGQCLIADEHQVTTSALWELLLAWCVFCLLVEKPNSALTVKSVRYYGKSGKATMVLSPMAEPGGPVSPKSSPTSPPSFLLQQEQKLIAQGPFPYPRAQGPYSLIAIPFPYSTRPSSSPF